MTNKRVKFSSFLLTINPNQSYDPGDVKSIKKASKKLKKSIDGLFNEGNIGKLIKINNEKDKEKDKKEIIRDINIHKSLEYGKEKGKLHAHLFVVINHYSKIQLDNQKIRSELKEDLGSIYYNNTLVRNKEDAQNILEYISKYQCLPQKYK